MRALQTGSLVFLLLVMTGCASTPSADLYASNVIFTVPYEAENSSLALSLTQSTLPASGPDAPGQNPLGQNSLQQSSLHQSRGTQKNDARQKIVQAVLRFHGLKQVSQFTLQALNATAVVAEFAPDRKLDDVVSALTRDHRVQSVQAIKPYTLLTYNDPYFSLQSTVNGDRIGSIHEISTGKNVVVGILDTGVDRFHPELADNIIYSRNLVAHDQASFDDDEHGTAVAGVIASAANNDLGIVGVAPDVRLMVFKACHQERNSRRTSCDSVSIIKALDDVLVQRPDVLNLSLSGPPDRLIELLLKEAYRSGIVLVAAVDESGGMARSFPANMKEVIAVGTSFATGASSAVGTSSAVDTSSAVGTLINHRSAFDDMILAPGTDMLTTTPGATYGFKSGSSMATAYVSGIVALMKERSPLLSNREVYRYLRASTYLDENELPVVDMCLAVNSAGEPAQLCERAPSMAVREGGVTDRFELTN